MRVCKTKRGVGLRQRPFFLFNKVSMWWMYISYFGKMTRHSLNERIQIIWSGWTLTETDAHWSFRAQLIRCRYAPKTRRLRRPRPSDSDTRSRHAFLSFCCVIYYMIRRMTMHMSVFIIFNNMNTFLFVFCVFRSCPDPRGWRWWSKYLKTNNLKVRRYICSSVKELLTSAYKHINKHIDCFQVN